MDKGNNKHYSKTTSTKAPWVIFENYLKIARAYRRGAGGGGGEGFVN